MLPGRVTSESEDSPPPAPDKVVVPSLPEEETTGLNSVFVILKVWSALTTLLS